MFVIPILLLLLLQTGVSFGRSNCMIARNSEPGGFWYCKFEGGENYQINLYYSADYGVTSELIRENTFSIEYNVNNGLLSAYTSPDDGATGCRFSYDGDYTLTAIDDQARMTFDCLPVTDSLIATNDRGEYSRDTFTTWVSSEFRNIDGNRSLEELYQIDWNTSDFVILSEEDDHTIISSNYSNNYHGTFNLIGRSNDLQYRQ